jgi:hypothetical protein
MRTSSPNVNAVINELEKFGIRDVDVIWGGKHPKVRFSVNGGPPHFIGASATPRDTCFSETKARAEVRRTLRSIGVIVAPDERPAPPPRQPSRVELLEQRVTALERVVAELKPTTNGVNHVGYY